MTYRITSKDRPKPQALKRAITPLLSVLVLVVFLPVATLGQCNETVLIDSVKYPVGDSWCGRKVDSTEMVSPTLLVELPDELTFEDYRIYVLPATRDRLIEMANAAKIDSVCLMVDSGFRSAAYQERIIRRRMANGWTVDEVLRFVAPPGYSEHHTGRAVDFWPSEAKFAHTDTYRWLRQNAGRFGFQESYPNDSTDLIPWESWHWSLPLLR